MIKRGKAKTSKIKGLITCCLKDFLFVCVIDRRRAVPKIMNKVIVL